MSETKKIKIGVRTDKVGSQVEDTLEIDAEDWDNMNELEKDEEVLKHLFENGLIEHFWVEE